MTTQLAKTNNNDGGMWTNEDIQLIRQTVANGTTDPEFKLFLYIAKKYQLDPLVKQIWCIKYGNQPAAIFTGRDGFNSIAQRSGLLNGMKTEPIFDDKNILIAARCQVYRKDMQYPFDVTVYRQEYDTGKSNWAKMPITMLCKVAESQTLRKAFDISGLYEPSELDQSVQQSNVEFFNDKQNPEYILVLQDFSKSFERALTLDELEIIVNDLNNLALPKNSLLRNQLVACYKEAKQRVETTITQVHQLPVPTNELQEAV